MIFYTRFDVIEPPDGKWGIDEGNNTWNGMINEVHQNVSPAHFRYRHLAGVCVSRGQVVRWTGYRCIYPANSKSSIIAA